MSPDVEQPLPRDMPEGQLLDVPREPHRAGDDEVDAAGGSATSRSGGAHVEHHHLLREPAEDRWRWRARIRRSRLQLRIYRSLVGVVGLFFVVLGFVSGPLPGPGGIPLVLLGLAIWSSEFVWARRLMVWFKRQLRRFRSWSRPQQTLAWVAFFACCGAFGYSYLLILGAPAWVPAQAEAVLVRLPGV